LGKTAILEGRSSEEKDTPPSDIFIQVEFDLNELEAERGKQEEIVEGEEQPALGLQCVGFTY
jgi:hypothetical protein